MTKRKLTRQQAWRIEKIQGERAQRANKKESKISEHLESGELGPEQKGMIIAHFGTQVLVEGEDGVQLRCYMRANLGGLVTGDQVVWCTGVDGTGIVVAKGGRHSELQRPNSHGELKPVAANVDYMIIVVAPEPEAHRNLIDRYLVAAENSEIVPVLCLNKMDLIDDDNHAHFAQMVADYQAIGYTFILACTKIEEGLDDLKAFLKDKISVFVGQSGVGKSSIIQALLPDEDIRVGKLSEASRKGKHTTTTAHLFHFPSGGDLIDSPGIREFGLWHMDMDEVLYGFREFRPYLGHCKFRDCAHMEEPGCAIRKAHEEGKISDLRMFNFQQIVASLNDVNMRWNGGD